MCGRYVNALTEQELLDEFELAVKADDPRLLPEDWHPSFNVAPTHEVLVVAGPTEKLPERHLEPARWGLVPSWAKDPGIGARMINARSETVAEKPSFRSAFAKRRCLVPASGYYEWQVTPDGKVPHYIHAADDAALAFAGLYEFWRDKAAGDGAEWLVTCTILTTAARGEMTAIHDRQPVMLTHEERGGWLDPESTPDELFAAIDAPAPELAWHHVGKAVGSPRNNSPELIAPVD